MSTRRPTEDVLDTTRDLDRWDLTEIIRAIHQEDRKACVAVGKVLGDVARAAEVLATTIGGGGRWFNVGAGTSGRLGMLDAAEIPPTFGLPPSRVQAVLAGGDKAFGKAVEAAEDNAEAAAWALRERGLGPGDAVVAISASGQTAFALGAVEAAHAVGARSIGVTCDPHSPLAEAVEIAVAAEVGPEVIAGSTRMKGGLAEKMILHLLSTSVMVRLGHVDGNLMTHVTAASQKLRDRALQLVVSLGGVDEGRARELLEACGGRAHEAIERARRSSTAPGGR